MGAAGAQDDGAQDDGAQPPVPVRILRPLLRTPRHALAAYAAQHALTWREDASNADTDRTRNFLRHELIPLLAERNPAIVETLARTAQLLAQEAERLDALDARLLAQATVAEAATVRLLLRHATLHNAAWGDRCGMLRLGLRRTFSAREVAMAHIEALAATVDGPAHATGPHPLVEGIAWSILYVDGEALLSIHRADALPVQPATPWLDGAWRDADSGDPLILSGCAARANGWMLKVEPVECPPHTTLHAPWELWLDATLFNGLRLTVPRAGMRMAPQGMGGRTRTLGDIFTDRKVPAALRPGWPVIVNAEGRVLWLCGLVVAEGAHAQPGAPALHLHWRKDNLEETQ